MRSLLVAAVASLLLSPATAVAACNGIGSTALAFGNYDVFAALPDDTAGSLTYNCTTPPGVTFSTSNNGASNPRQMVRLFGGAGADVLRYDIYVDAARTQTWSATTPVVLPTGAQTISYFGRAFAGQDIQTGFYFDFITITLNF